MRSRFRAVAGDTPVNGSFTADEFLNDFRAARSVLWRPRMNRVAWAVTVAMVGTVAGCAAEPETPEVASVESAVTGDHSDAWMNAWMNGYPTAFTNPWLWASTADANDGVAATWAAPFYNVYVGLT